MSTESFNILLFIVVLCFLAGGLISNKLMASNKSLPKRTKYIYVKSSSTATKGQESKVNSPWPMAIVFTTVICVCLFFGVLIERNASLLERKMEENERFNIVRTLQHTDAPNNTYIPILEANNKTTRP